MTIASIELAYTLGIPTMRINTGRWGTIKDFDDLMKHRGIEPPLPGYTDEDAFPWVIEASRSACRRREKCGVVLGLENHWGLARTPEGLLRIVNAVNSPWLRVTLDTGNFLEDPYEKLAKRSRPRRRSCRPRPTTAAASGTRSTSTTTASPRSSASTTTAATSRWSSKGTKTTRRRCPRAWPCCGRRSRSERSLTAGSTTACGAEFDDLVGVAGTGDPAQVAGG